MKIKKKMKEKKQINMKDLMPVIIALVVLVILVIALIFTIFYKSEGDLVVPDAPNFKDIAVGVTDYEKNGDPNKLLSGELKKSDVTYKIISNYYRNGILLSNTQVDFNNDEFIVHSGKFSETAFVSTIDKDGKLKWVQKITDKNYKKIIILKVFKEKDEYYAFGIGKKTNAQDVIAIKLAANGQQEKIEVIASDTENTLKTAVKLDGGYALVSEGTENIKIYYITKEFKTWKKTYSLKEDKQNIFFANIPHIKGSSYKDKKLSIVLAYTGGLEETMYLLNCNIDSNTCTLKNFSGLSAISSPFNNELNSINDNYYTMHGKMVYKFNNEGTLLNKFDYRNLELENKDDYITDKNVMKDENIENFKNNYVLRSVNKNGTDVLVKGSTAFSYVYDLMDENLKIKKRYVINKLKYDYKDGVLLKTFYIDGKIYEFYSYGSKTPSIMVSIIG